MRPKKNQIINLKSTPLHDPFKNRTLTFFVKAEEWEAFKNSNSFVKRVELASQVKDSSGLLIKNEFKNNSGNLEIRIMEELLVVSEEPSSTAENKPQSKKEAV